LSSGVTTSMSGVITSRIFMDVLPSPSAPGMAHGPLRGPNCGRRSRNSSASPRERPSDGTARRLRIVEGGHRRNATARQAARFLALFHGSSRQRMTLCGPSPSKSAPPTYHRNTRLMPLVPGAAGCRIRTGADDRADDALQHGKSRAAADRCGAGARNARVSAPCCEPSPKLTTLASRIVPSYRRFWNYRD